MLKKISIANFFYLLFVLSICACKKSMPGYDAHALFFNGCENTTGLSISVNNNNVTSSLSYLINTGYMQVVSNVNATIKITDSSGLLATQGVTLSKASYSFYLLGSQTAPFLKYKMDDPTNPPAGKAKIEVIKGHIDSLTETVTIGSSQFQLDNTFSNTISIPAGTNTITVLNAKTSATLFTDTKNFESGKIYTMIVTGYPGGAGAGAMTSTLVTHN